MNCYGNYDDDAVRLGALQAQATCQLVSRNSQRVITQFNDIKIFTSRDARPFCFLVMQRFCYQGWQINITEVLL